HPSPHDPKKEAATRIVAHFKDSGIRTPDRYVRAARIGNVFWQWGYAIRKNDLDQRDCPAVRMLISFRRSRRASIKRSAVRSPSRTSTPRKTRKRTHRKKQR